MGSLFDALQAANATINGFDEMPFLEPVLEKIANALGAEKIIVTQRSNDALIQRTHCDDDRLSQHLEDWTVFAEGPAYTWSSSHRIGQARQFPATPHGHVVALTAGRRDSDQIRGTLTVLCGDTPMTKQSTDFAGLVALSLAGLFKRLDSDAEIARLGELAKLREVVSARLLPRFEADTDAYEAVTHVLSAIAETFSADEVLWGNRHNPKVDGGSQRYVRRLGVSQQLPPSRLMMKSGPLDRNSRIVIDRLDDSAFRNLGLDPSAYPHSMTWTTPLQLEDTVVGGLGLLFLDKTADPTVEEIRALADISKLLQQYTVRVDAERALQRRHDFDRLSLEIARSLLRASTEGESANEVITWTLEKLGRAFNADQLTLQSGRDTGSAIRWDSTHGLERYQHILDARPKRFMSDAVQQIVDERGSALLRVPDLPEDARSILEQLGYDNVTILACRTVPDDRNILLGALSWDHRDWTDVHLTTLTYIGTLLQQAVDTIEARQRAALFDEMERLAARVSTELNKHDAVHEALGGILPDISSTVGGLGASWFDVSHKLRRFDIVRSVSSDGASFPPNAKLGFSEDDWEQIGTTAWPAGFYTRHDPPMNTIARTVDPEWSDRLMIPVIRNGLVVSGFGIIVDGPRPTAVLQVLSRIAELVQEAFERSRGAQLFATTFDSAPTGQLVLDEQGVVQALNAAAAALGLVRPGERWDTVDTTFFSGRGEHEFELSTDRHQRWFRVRSSVVTDDNIRPITVVNIEDVSKERASQAALEHDASHDQLTGLANRRLLDEKLSTAACDTGATVVMVDVDRFKSINDSLGHHAGDAVLLALADRLRTTVRDGDLVCRFGGDEFAILLKGCSERHELAAFATRMLDVIREPVDFDGHTISPTCSLGLASIPRGEDPEAVLRFADAALVTAKNAGRNGFAFFDPSDTDILRSRFDTEMGIQRGLENGEFVTWFQPEYDLTSGAVRGLEALMRWQRPGVGVVPADEFITIAEDMGAARRMSELALLHSCALASGWNGQSHRVRVGVNITAAQLQGDQLERNVLHALAQHDLQPERLCLELTERSLLLDIDNTIRTLARLRDLGIEIAIDDFGTGFSSLAWLKRLPVDTIKIDGSFVKDIATDLDDRTIVRSIIELAHALGIETVAEGIEHADQVAVLRELGCQRGQGWLWSPAIDPMDVADLLRAPQH
ncbi:MAG: EAL domain-containing protein [Acidimicrobiales bacterium]